MTSWKKKYISSSAKISFKQQIAITFGTLHKKIAMILRDGTYLTFTAKRLKASLSTVKRDTNSLANRFRNIGRLITLGQLRPHGARSSRTSTGGSVSIGFSRTVMKLAGQRSRLTTDDQRTITLFEQTVNLLSKLLNYNEIILTQRRLNYN